MVAHPTGATRMRWLALDREWNRNRFAIIVARTSSARTSSVN
jgi:hypothetical protein